MAPPLPPEPKCDICMQRCYPVTTANCAKGKNVYVHACLGITSCSNLPGMIFWSCKTCLPTFAADISALNRISAMEKIECVDSLIRDVALLRNEVSLLRKPNFPFLNAAKTRFNRNRIDSSSSSQGISGSRKRKAKKSFWNLTKEN